MGREFFQWLFLELLHHGLQINSGHPSPTPSSIPKVSPLPDLTKAPEALDPHTIERWLNGSVWSLLGLNVLALGFFVASLLAPQLIALWNGIRKFYQDWHDRRIAYKDAHNFAPTAPVASEMASSTAAPAEATSVAAVATAAVAEVAAALNEPTPAPTPSPVEASAAAPAPSPEAPMAEPITEVTAIDSPPAFTETPTEILQPLEEGVKEELDLPTFTDDDAPPLFTPPPEAAAEIAAAAAATPSPEPSPVLAPVPEAPAPAPAPEAPPTFTAPTPASMPAGATPNDAQMEETLKSLEETLNEALDGTSEATEEINIFDPAMIDQVLSGEDNKGGT